jgi:hypothetical protein
MTSMLSNLKKNSKRYIKLKETYKLDKKNKMDLAFLQGLKNNHPHLKYIVIQKPVKKSFLKYIPSWFYKLSVCSAAISLFYFYKKEILEYMKNFQKRNFNENSKKYINSLLVSSEIREGGVILLENIFKHEHSKASTVQLLNNLFEDPKVMESTKAYGVGLFNELLKEEEIKAEVKKLFKDLLAMEEIKLESVALLKYLLEKEESKDIMSQYFKVIFLRSDIIKSLSSVITDSAIYTMTGATTKKKFAEFVIDVWSDPNLRWYVIKKSLNFWQPATTTVENGRNLNLNDKQIREELTSLEMMGTRAASGGLITDKIYKV